ncbi:hypothetical protein PG990_000107 [Apiospora arundinis]
MEKGSGYHDIGEKDDVQLKHCMQPTKGKGAGKAKRKYPDERAIADIEWIHSNYEKMANKWVEAKKENLVLQRKIADLEAQKPLSPVLRQPKTTRPTTRSTSLVRGTQRRKTNLKAKVCQRLRRISRSAPSSADSILSSIESDSSWDAGSRNTELSDSGSDGYQGDCEAVPKRSPLRLGSEYWQASPERGHGVDHLTRLVGSARKSNDQHVSEPPKAHLGTTGTLLLQTCLTHQLLPPHTPEAQEPLAPYLNAPFPSLERRAAPRRNRA